MKNSKQNRAFASPLELLNNFKYIKSEKKAESNNSSHNLKKSNTAFKKFEKSNLQQPLIILTDLKKQQKINHQNKSITFRSPERKNIDEQRKSINLKKKDILTGPKSDIKSIEFIQGIYGRTSRLKTTIDTDKRRNMTLQKHKIMIDNFSFQKQSTNTTFRQSLGNFNQKINMLIKTLDDSNDIFSKLICQLIQKVKDMVGQMLEQYTKEVIKSVKSYEKINQQMNEKIKQIIKQNENVQLKFTKLKQQYDSNKIQLRHLKRICHKQKNQLLIKAEKEYQVNKLIYQLRKRSLNVDFYYQNIKMNDQVQEFKIASDNNEPQSNQNLSNLTI